MRVNLSTLDLASQTRHGTCNARVTCRSVLAYNGLSLACSLPRAPPATRGEGLPLMPFPASAAGDREEREAGPVIGGS